MKLARCENGHFYDTDKWCVCPHCMNGPTIDPSEKVEPVFDWSSLHSTCPKGHTYSSFLGADCPECKKEIEKKIAEDKDIIQYGYISSEIIFVCAYYKETYIRRSGRIKIKKGQGYAIFTGIPQDCHLRDVTLSINSVKYSKILNICAVSAESDESEKVKREELEFLMKTYQEQERALRELLFMPVNEGYRLAEKLKYIEEYPDRMLKISNKMKDTQKTITSYVVNCKDDIIKKNTEYGVKVYIESENDMECDFDLWYTETNMHWEPKYKMDYSTMSNTLKITFSGLLYLPASHGMTLIPNICLTPQDIDDVALKIDCPDSYFEISEPTNIDAGSDTCTLDLRELDVEKHLLVKAQVNIEQACYATAIIHNALRALPFSSDVEIYKDGEKISQVDLQTVIRQDMAEIPLGKDNSILVEKRKSFDQTSDNAITGRRHRVLSYVIEITNLKSVTTAMEIVDQIPIVHDRDVRVELERIEDGEINVNNGEIQWELCLEPRQTYTITYSYALIYPTDKELNLDI